MRKKCTLGILLLLLVSVLTGCDNYSYEESQLEAVVVQCVEGDFHPDSSYMSTANMYFTKKNYNMANHYKNLAYNNGKYDYNITINVEGEEYVVIRSEQYEVGDTISITKVDVYENEQFVRTEYQ